MPKIHAVAVTKTLKRKTQMRNYIANSLLKKKTPGTDVPQGEDLKRNSKGRNHGRGWS